MSGPAFFTAVIGIAKNEDWIQSFVYEVAGPIAVNLTGSVLRMQIRKNEADHTALVSLSSPSSGIAITDAAAGKFTITIDRAASSLLAAGDYVADVVRLRPDGYIERMIDATVNVVEGTTR
jgi:hypothetical protein